MNICILGSHSTGKSVLCDALVKYYQERNAGKYLIVQDGNSRQAKSEGCFINENANLDGQTRIVQIYVDKFKHWKNIGKHIIHVDSVARFYAYTEYAQRPKVQYYREMLRLFASYELNKVMDIIFYLPIEFPIVSDGVRSMDVDFQKEIDNILMNLVRNDSITPVTLLTGSVEKRLNRVLEELGTLNIMTQERDYNDLQ
jgi:nicotinamide riboside kinase